MSFIVVCFFWFLGLAVTSYTLIPVLIILRFALPFTRELERHGVLIDQHPIVKRYLTSVMVLLISFITITFIMSLIPGHDFRGFIGGSAFSLLIGIWKIGRNKENTDEYIQKNKPYLKQEFFSTTSTEQTTDLFIQGIKKAAHENQDKSINVSTTASQTTEYLLQGLREASLESQEKSMMHFVKGINSEEKET